MEEFNVFITLCHAYVFIDEIIKKSRHWLMYSHPAVSMNLIIM